LIKRLSELYCISERKNFQKKYQSKTIQSAKFLFISSENREIKVSPLEAIDSLKFYAEKQIPMSEEEMEELQHF
jgi:integrase/recombinase XerC